MTTLSQYIYESKFLVTVEESSHYAVSTVADGSKRIKRQWASESARTLLPGGRCDCPGVITNGTQCKPERAQDGCFVKEKWDECWFQGRAL
jgi:hypothetical protein